MLTASASSKQKLRASSCRQPVTQYSTRGQRNCALFLPRTYCKTAAKLHEDAVELPRSLHEACSKSRQKTCACQFRGFEAQGVTRDGVGALTSLHCNSLRSSSYNTPSAQVAGTSLTATTLHPSHGNGKHATYHRMSTRVVACVRSLRCMTRERAGAGGGHACNWLMRVMSLTQGCTQVPKLCKRGTRLRVQGQP